MFWRFGVLNDNEYLLRIIVWLLIINYFFGDLIIRSVEREGIKDFFCGKGGVVKCLWGLNFMIKLKSIIFLVIDLLNGWRGIGIVLLGGSIYIFGFS